MAPAAVADGSDSIKPRGTFNILVSILLYVILKMF